MLKHKTDLNPKKSCCILFVKAPVAGAVKTRLAGSISPEGIAAIYMGFVADMLRMLEGVGADIRIAYDPPDAGERISQWLGNRFPLFPQDGSELGERMGSAFTGAFANGYERAVLLGSDIPDLPARVLMEACDALSRVPAVIGPSRDGGYYLIGFRSDGYTEQVFEEMRWSTDRVYSETMGRFSKLRCRVHLLPPWRDVDTPDDLIDLVRRTRKNPDQIPQTWKILEQFNLLPEA